MKTRYPIFLFIVLTSSILIGCSPAETIASTSTPTLVTRRESPTSTTTSTATKPPEATATESIVLLEVPSPFNMTLLFTNGSCETGTPSYTYTFSIEGTMLTLVQTDAGITSTGTFDPLNGMFSTSVDVGAGVETYDGTIDFDGTLISVSGSYGWTPTGGTTCTFDISGTATP